MTRRTERINVVLRNEISRVLSTELKDPRLSSVVSVTRVEVSPDLHVAKAYVSVLGDQTDKIKTLKALKSASGYVHRNIRRRLTLKTIPSLDFHVDESIEQGAELLKLIREMAPAPEESETS